jgi:hypothetical protein
MFSLMYQHPSRAKHRMYYQLCVAIDGVRTGEQFYWPLIHTTRNYKHLQRYRYLHTLQITTAPAKTFSLLAVSSAVPWQRFLILEILQLHALRFYPHSLPCRTQLTCLLTPGLAVFHTNLLVFSSQTGFQLTDGQSVSNSWCRAPYYCLTTLLL